MDYALKARELREEAGSLSDQVEELYVTAEAEERDLTEEELNKADDLVEQGQRKIKQAENFEKLAEQKSGVAVDDKPGVQKGAKVENRVADHKLRTVRYFNALATQKESQTEGDSLMRKLNKEIASMPAEQYADEHKEAADIINNSSLSAVKKANLITSLEIDTRLHTTSTSDTPKAGYLLPKPFLAELFVIVEQYGVARREFRTIPMTSKDIDLKNVATKVVANWIDEGSNITADDFVFAEGSLNVKKLAGLTNWTTELEEDAAISLLPITQEIFAESIALKEDQAAFLGDGTSTYGSFTGLTNLTNAQTVEGESGETDATFLDEATIRAMKNSLSQARQMGAKWYGHRTVKDAIEQFEDTEGHRIFQTNLATNGPNTLLGFPFVEVEAMPAYSSVGADEAFLVLGNCNRALMGQRRGITADISRDAVIQNGSGTIVYNAFQADGALLRITERVGFKVPSAFESAFAVAKTAAS